VKAAKMARAIYIKLAPGKDDALAAWLSEWAKTGSQSDIIKLVLKKAAGLPLADSEIALEQQCQPGEPGRVATPDAGKSDADYAVSAARAFVGAIFQEIEMRNFTNPSRGSAPASATTEPVESSGLDMSRSRKRPGTPKVIAVEVPVSVEFDADEARERLLKSIFAYGKEFREEV
jgi:hypothetical protein